MIVYMPMQYQPDVEYTAPLNILLIYAYLPMIYLVCTVHVTISSL